MVKMLAVGVRQIGDKGKEEFHLWHTERGPVDQLVVRRSGIQVQGLPGTPTYGDDQHLDSGVNRRE